MYKGAWSKLLHGMWNRLDSETTSSIKSKPMDSPKPLVNTELRKFASNWEPSAENKNCKNFQIISVNLREFWL